ncbi:hypothetical protein CR155_17015 [Pollutimonas nitritireducens]|uniref:Uncharacterized protein n=1 Tax=Pollutimonas nitritireducens TaxID=2045209 RepID=A0A2N4UCM1_9BURK|nr:hypothetical protein CR155_17015 [Pollutimonas nitritireducens]
MSIDALLARGMIAPGYCSFTDRNFRKTAANGGLSAPRDLATGATDIDEASVAAAQLQRRAKKRAVLVVDASLKL